MLKNDTLKNGTSRIGLYGSAPRVLMLHHCVNLKAIRYESTSLSRLVADNSHCVIVG